MCCVACKLREKTLGMIRIILPFQLRTLAHIEGEVQLSVDSPVTLRRVLDALETEYPMIRGTIRDHHTFQRRPFIRFFACEQDLSNASFDSDLPPTVVSGEEPLMVIGALAGG